MKKKIYKKFLDGRSFSRIYTFFSSSISFDVCLILFFSTTPQSLFSGCLYLMPPSFIFFSFYLFLEPQRFIYLFSYILTYTTAFKVGGIFKYRDPEESFLILCVCVCVKHCIRNEYTKHGRFYKNVYSFRLDSFSKWESNRSEKLARKYSAELIFMHVNAVYSFRRRFLPVMAIKNQK